MQEKTTMVGAIQPHENIDFTVENNIFMRLQRANSIKYWFTFIR